MIVFDWTSFYIGFFAGAFIIALIVIVLMVKAHSNALRDQFNQGHF